MLDPDEVQMPDRRRGEWRRRCKTLLITGIVMFILGTGAGPGNIVAVSLTDGGLLLIVVSLIGLLVAFVRNMSPIPEAALGGDEPHVSHESPLVGGEHAPRHRDPRRSTLRTLAITQNVTLDGSIEMLGDWFDPQGQGDVDNSDLLEELHRQDSAADGFLAGRQTFEDLRRYWPEQTNDATGITNYLNQVQKYVVSSTMTDPQWQNSTVLSGDPIEEVRALKEQPGKDVVATGSITLCHALIEADLVDEYRLFVYPVVQGRGRRLFPDGIELPTLRLLEVKAFRSGITYSRYARR